MKKGRDEGLRGDGDALITRFSSIKPTGNWNGRVIENDE